jgi:hypothetical protein
MNRTSRFALVACACVALLSAACNGSPPAHHGLRNARARDHQPARYETITLRSDAPVDSSL